jgi:hypothetical protein
MAIQDALAGLTLSLVFVSACKGSPAPGSGPAAEDADAAAQRSRSGEVDELMSAGQLLGAYADNAGDADAKLKGKRIRIWGKATDVTRDPAGLLSISVGSAARTDGPRVQCLFPDLRASDEAAGITAGADITVDGTCAGLATNVTLRECRIPRCAMPVCEALRASGVADECKAATKDWSDSVTFRMPSAMSHSGFGGGYVECEPSDKVYYLMVNDLRTHARPNQLVLASPKARVVISLGSDDPIPPEVVAKTRALVEGL